MCDSGTNCGEGCKTMRTGGGVRLQKLLAEAGVGSRRACEKLIAEGRVTVGGVTILTQGTLADPAEIIAVDGVPITIQKKKVYILLNKPEGYITSAKDQFGRKTVLDLIGDSVPARVFPVGRLDYHTRGLLLLTNDGEFAYYATHPGHEIEKVYEVLTPDCPASEVLERLREGVVLDDGFRTAPARVFFSGGNSRGDIGGKNTKDEHSGRDSNSGGNGKGLYRIMLIIHEGKNRQVRRMFEAVNLRVNRLTRVATGMLTLGGLAAGGWRYISYDEAMKIGEKAQMAE